LGSVKIELLYLGNSKNAQPFFRWGLLGLMLLPSYTLLFLRFFHYMHRITSWLEIRIGSGVLSLSFFSQNTDQQKAHSRQLFSCWFGGNFNCNCIAFIYAFTGCQFLAFLTGWPEPCVYYALIM